MRIVIAQRLTLEHGIRGGMEVQAQALAEGLAARGHEITILTTPHPDGRETGQENGLAVHYISPGSYRSYQRRWWRASYEKLAELHKQERFDVLLSQSAGALAYFARIKALGLPSVTVLHGTMLTGIRSGLRTAGSLKGVYRLARLLATFPVHWRYWRRACLSVDAWIAVSVEVAQGWAREMRLDLGKIAVIPNGVDTSQFRPDQARRIDTRQRMGIPEHIPVLLSVGRLEEEKGVHHAIELQRMLLESQPEAVLLIAGTGPYLSVLQRLAEPLKEAVHLLGHVPREQLPELMNAADLLVMPTLRDEGLPMTTIEALASGLPVLASRVGGLPTAIEDGVSGLLLPMGERSAWLRAIVGLLSDEPRRSAMSRSARQVALARFSQQGMVEETERVLFNVFNARMH